MTSEDVRKYMEEHLNNLSEYLPGNVMSEIAALFSMVCEMADRVYDQEGCSEENVIEGEYEDFSDDSDRMPEVQ